MYIDDVLHACVNHEYVAVCACAMVVRCNKLYPYNSTSSNKLRYYWLLAKCVTLDKANSPAICKRTLTILYASTKNHKPELKAICGSMH